MIENEIQVITGTEAIKDLLDHAKNRQGEFFEGPGKDMFPIDTEWCVDDESEIANVITHRLHSLRMTFNNIHHLQGVHELGLNPGWSMPDFYANGEVAFYQPTEMPPTLEPYLGSQLVFEADFPKEQLPKLGGLALRNSNYVALVSNEWRASRRRQDCERHDKSIHFFFSARLYFDPIAAEEESNQ